MPKVVFASWGAAAVILLGVIVRAEQNKRNAVIVQSLAPPSVQQPVNVGVNATTPQPVTPSAPSSATNQQSSTNTTAPKNVSPVQQKTPPPTQYVPRYRYVPRTTVS